jgi:hypothetical protein
MASSSVRAPHRATISRLARRLRPRPTAFDAGLTRGSSKATGLLLSTTHPAVFARTQRPLDLTASLQTHAAAAAMSVTQTAIATSAEPGSTAPTAPTLVLRAEHEAALPAAHAPRRGAAFLPTLTEFTHDDPGRRALNSAHPRAIFEAPGVTSSDITPVTGRIYDGIRLDELDGPGRDQVALEVARRGVVAFRGQRFTERGPEWYKQQWGAVRRIARLLPDRRPPY